jgi:hypothetical protein
MLFGSGVDVMFRNVIVVLSLAAAIALTAVPAFAYQCPYDMAAIDAALAKNPKLSPAVLARVKQLRAEGEALHRKGGSAEAHSNAVKKFGAAKRLLGI